MSRSKLSLAVALALVLTLGLAASSWARGGFGGGPGAMNLTPEQAGKLFDLKEKFRNDTASLRKQIWVKGAELKGLWQAKEPDEKQIQAKQKEINALKGQMQEKGTTFRLEARKIAPDAKFGHGWGGGGMGPGGGMGAGCGMGPGGGMCPMPGMGPGPGTGPGPGPGGDKGPGKAM
jgi:zinc resistance-associated protein